MRPVELALAADRSLLIQSICHGHSPFKKQVQAPVFYQKIRRAGNRTTRHLMVELTGCREFLAKKSSV
jgi:hypothetical protein